MDAQHEAADRPLADQQACLDLVLLAEAQVVERELHVGEEPLGGVGRQTIGHL
jgi:hypothetical protein